MGIIVELYKFLCSRKKFWIIPLVVVMCLLGALMFLSSGTAVAPFIYTLF